MIQDKMAFDYMQVGGSIILADGFGVLLEHVLIRLYVKAPLSLLLLIYFLDAVDMPVSGEAIHSCSVCQST